MLLGLGQPDPLNFQSTQEMTHLWVGSGGGVAEVTGVQRPFFEEGESESCSVVSDFATPWTIVHGILQARILEWVAFPSPGDLPNPGIELRSLPALPDEPQGKPLKRVHGFY